MVFKVKKDKEVKTSNGNHGESLASLGDGFRRIFELKERQLVCNSFCRFVCLNGAMYYCSCCSCCGNRRRLTVTTEADLDLIESIAKDEVRLLLSDLDEPIACLDPSYDSAIVIEKH